MSFASAQTVLTNPTADSQFYTFLPPHGQEVAAGADVTLDGDLFAKLSAPGSKNKRKFDTFKYALDNGLISVKSLPGAIAFDATADAPVELGVDDGAITYADPSWTP